MFLHRPGKQSLKRRIGAMTGMVALAMHLFLTLAQIVPMKAAAETLSGMPSFLVICVAYGDANADDTDKDKNGGTPSCPVCLAKVLAGGLVASNAAEVDIIPEYSRLSVVLAADEMTHGRQPLRRLSRAPPFFA